MISCEFCEIFKNPFVHRTPPMVASGSIKTTKWRLSTCLNWPLKVNKFSCLVSNGVRTIAPEEKLAPGQLPPGLLLPGKLPTRKIVSWTIAPYMIAPGLLRLDNYTKDNCRLTISPPGNSPRMICHLHNCTEENQKLFMLSQQIETNKVCNQKAHKILFKKK